MDDLILEKDDEADEEVLEADEEMALWSTITTVKSRAIRSINVPSLRGNEQEVYSHIWPLKMTKNCEINLSSSRSFGNNRTYNLSFHLSLPL